MKKFDVTLDRHRDTLTVNAKNPTDAVNIVGLTFNWPERPVQVTDKTYEIGTVLVHIEEKPRK
jgi:hypothetical protein